MYYAIVELRLMAEKAVENARHVDDASDKNFSEGYGNKIFEILAK